jgi:hypothetical protein
MTKTEIRNPLMVEITERGSTRDAHLRQRLHQLRPGARPVAMAVVTQRSA